MKQLLSVILPRAFNSHIRRHKHVQITPVTSSVLFCTHPTENRGNEVERKVNTNVEESFKKVMRQVPQPVVVVTTSKLQEAGDWMKRGVTCSSFTSVSLRPPIISFSVNRPSRMHDLLLETNRFAVHVLAQNQVGHAMHFSKPVTDKSNQFENIQHEVDSQGTPILRDTCAVLLCKKHTVSDIGDHDVWYGEVLHSYKNSTIPQSPLLHYSRGYRSIGDETFLQAFETQTLPFEEWTHEAHLRMAWSYIREHGKEEAIPVIRNGIKKFNEQNMDKISRGYHETVTMFYINMVSEAVSRSNHPDGTFEDFLQTNHYLTEKNLLFDYYSDEAINKKDAYTSFILPDKKPLP